MTTLHEAAQQALDGAKWINDEQAIVPSHLLVALRAALAQEAEPTVKDSLQVMRQALRNAEWQDKHIHPIGAESFQNWLLKIYLPVPLSATDKSPEAALRAALAQEEPEPVAWSPRLDYPGYEKQRVWANGKPRPEDVEYWAKYGGIDIAFTAPPAARVPLTDEQIKYATLEQQNHLLDHIYEYGVSAEGVTQRIYKLARAIERAHGITNQSTQGE